MRNNKSKFERCIFLTLSYLGILIVIIFITYLITSKIFSGATIYCPLSHKLNAHMYCEIIDQLKGRTLIQHYNAKTDECSLSIYDGKKLLWIKLPNNVIDSLNHNVCCDSLKFDPFSKDSLIFKDTRIPIVVIK